jgi:hypothetical protein
MARSGRQTNISTEKAIVNRVKTLISSITYTYETKVKFSNLS